MHEDLLKRHLELVIEANKTTNITRISSWKDGMVLHVQDSLLGLDALNACPEGRYADIGTGAGYPGIPLAIEAGRPTLLVDSVQKKVQILDGFIEELGLDNVSTYAGRIEDLGREQAGQFAAISARALSKLSVLLVEQDGISDEDLDRIADTAIATIQDILKHFDVGEVTIDEYEGDEGELILDITGDDLAVLIGRHGKTLDALQFLVSAITVRTMGFRYPVIVDVEGYKNRQREKLESIARNAAAKAAKQHRSVKLRPMTPYERRIVHIALRDDERVETASEGEGSARHVVVVPL